MKVLYSTVPYLSLGPHSGGASGVGFIPGRYHLCMMSAFARLLSLLSTNDFIRIIYTGHESTWSIVTQEVHLEWIDSRPVSSDSVTAHHPATSSAQPLSSHEEEITKGTTFMHGLGPAQQLAWPHSSEFKPLIRPNIIYFWRVNL
jgi:hypothetical protein